VPPRLTSPRPAPTLLRAQGTGGECGLRGGYVELTNIHPGSMEEMYKIASINLSPNTIGQVAMSCLVNPPKPGDESYALWDKERLAELGSLRRRAHMVTDAFNALENVTCNFTEGAMYAFPQVRASARLPAGGLAAGAALLRQHRLPPHLCRGCAAALPCRMGRALAPPPPRLTPTSPSSPPQLSLPAKAIEAAKKAGKAPDVFYCLRLLEATGISTVPGSGFGQEEGTFHLRTTILPREEAMQTFCDKFRNFHEDFMNQYR
jgi:aspartate/methionine/tyrosine aminotransferase